MSNDNKTQLLKTLHYSIFISQNDTSISVAIAE